MMMMMMMRLAVIGLTIAFCLGIGPAEAQNISDEALRHFDRGMAAVEMAKTDADYKDAVHEFGLAKELAPDWPAVYYNLGLVQEKLGRYIDASENLTKYLELSPGASDSREVKRAIARIEYRVEKETGITALMWAAIRGHAGIVEALLAKGADVNVKYKFTSTSSSPVSESRRLAYLASSHPPRIDSEPQTNESKALVNSYGLSIPRGCRPW
ncbi:MAG: hypothetical protein L3J03_10855 [Desulfobacterales bacterium]|nr:hypothetical protein [Desulfobacterales bacterium]